METGYYCAGNKCLLKSLLKGILLILVFAVIITIASVPLFAAETGDGVAAVEESDTQKAAIPAKVSLPAAAEAAEKMYYCGELYIFSDSMLKTNYKMAAIAANLEEAVRTEVLSKSPGYLDELIIEYNNVSESYNSWVDVKPELESFVAQIHNKKVYSKANLQTAFRYTLTTVNNTMELLESARGFMENSSNMDKNAVNTAAAKAIRSAAKANNAVEPMAKRAMTNYRLMFDEFSKQAGIKLEYHAIETAI